MGADGRDLRHLPISRWWGWPRQAVWAVWSSDESRVAIYCKGDLVGKDAGYARLILTMARDGADLRFLVKVDTDRSPASGEGRFRPWNPPRSEEPDLTVCSRSIVVPEPDFNPGLVRDCETLLSIRDALAGSADLVWNGRFQISKWEGVTVSGSPPRVQELVLVLRGLIGKLPPELGRLTG